MNGHVVRGGSANRPDRFDRLSLEVRGVAKQIRTEVDTSVYYADVFGKFHSKYFRVYESLGAQPPYSINPSSFIGEVGDPSAAVRCLQATAEQRDMELDRSGIEGLVRTPTRVYAKLAQGRPITLADVEASAKLETPDECSGV